MNDPKEWSIQDEVTGAWWIDEGWSDEPCNHNKEPTRFSSYAKATYAWRDGIREGARIVPAPSPKKEKNYMADICTYCNIPRHQCSPWSCREH